MLRLVALVLVLTSFARPLPAAAQTPPPVPPGYAVMTVAMDDLILPLLTAAEADVAQGRPALAAARAQLVLESVGAGSTLRVRAEGVRVLAQQALAGASPEAPPSEVVLEPLVTQAEADAQRGLQALAIARLDFVQQRVPAGSALATRAAALRQAAAQMSAAAPPPVVAPPVVSAPPAAPIVQPYQVPPSARPVATVDAERPAARAADSTRRGDGELVELYITAASYGLYAGFWIPFAAGLEARTGSGAGGSPEALAYTLSMIAGSGLFALGVAGLDSGEGLRTGVGPTISTGIRWGTAMGLLMWGALDDEFDPVTVLGPCPFGGTGCTMPFRPGWTERTAMPFAFGLGGLLIGAVVGYGTQPNTSQVRFVESSGLWGTAIGFLLSLSGAEDSPQGFAITAAGQGLGLLTGAVMAAAGAYVTPRRAWLMTVGLTVGVGASAGISALTTTALGDFPYQIFGAVGAATGLAGLVITYFLTEGMDDVARTRGRAEQAPPVQLALAPVLDGQGLMATLGGHF